MVKCPKCGRTYDDSWSKCLACGIELEHVKEELDQEEKNAGYDKFGGSKFLIVAYSILLMIIAPILIFLLYLVYMYSWKAEFIKHGDRELKKAIVTDKSNWKSEEKSDKKH